jgi:dihydrofolate reductase
VSKVVMQLSVSLDGFVAGPNDGPDNPLGDGGRRLFQWYRTGDTEFAQPAGGMVFHVSRASAELLGASWPFTGASVFGRRTFDISRGWGGNPPSPGPSFVVTHSVPPEWVYAGSPFTFVTDGVESAVAMAQAVAGDGHISVAGASIVQQCLRAGLLDEIQLDLVPVLLGGGVRLFDHLGGRPIELERTRVVETPDVTHLIFRVLK